MLVFVLKWKPVFKYVRLYSYKELYDIENSEIWNQTFLIIDCCKQNVSNHLNTLKLKHIYE